MDLLLRRNIMMADNRPNPIQLIRNGDFVDDSYWTLQSNYSSLSVSDGVATVGKSATGTYGGMIYSNTALHNIDTSHIYYFSGYGKAGAAGSNNAITIGFHASNGTVGGNTTVANTTTDWERIRAIVSPAASSNRFVVKCGRGASPAGSNCYAKKVMLIDLTATFGAGNEPTTVEEFEAIYPNDYYEYNPQTV